jgi:hypothetical protein
MAFISSVEVTLWNASSLGLILPVLLATGWQFWEREVRWACFQEVGEEEDLGTERREGWQELVHKWDAMCDQGKTVQIMYQWQDDSEKQVTIWFSRKHSDTSLLTMDCTMYPAWQRLCGNITDYSWYLDRLVCPLEQSQLGVLYVTCSDDNA